MTQERRFVVVSLTLAVLAVPAIREPLAARAQGQQSSDLSQATQLIRQGNDADALAAVRRELASNPSSAAAANLLDTLGQSAEARKILQQAIDAAADPAAKASAQRAMAMSYAFSGDCANTIKHEELVIAYWKTQEQAAPQNAFYQEGEMANEGARVCIDTGDLATAEKWYRAGYEMGIREPGNQTHPKSLWDYRLAHALGRIAARRKDAAEAARQVAAARKALDGDPAMAAQQERFFPYLTGYVALYTGDLARAEADLTKAVTTPGNENDPFMHCLLAMTYGAQKQTDKAKTEYDKAYRLATGHNPPGAFVRRVARDKR